MNVTNLSCLSVGLHLHGDLFCCRWFKEMAVPLSVSGLASTSDRHSLLRHCLLEWSLEVLAIPDAVSYTPCNLNIEPLHQLAFNLGSPTCFIAVLSPAPACILYQCFCPDFVLKLLRLVTGIFLRSRSICAETRTGQLLNGFKFLPVLSGDVWTVRRIILC